MRGRAGGSQGPEGEALAELHEGAGALRWLRSSGPQAGGVSRPPRGGEEVGLCKEWPGHTLQAALLLVSLLALDCETFRDAVSMASVSLKSKEEILTKPEEREIIPDGGETHYAHTH